MYSDFVNYSIGLGLSEEAQSEASVSEVPEVSGFNGEMPISITKNNYLQLKIASDQIDSIQDISFNLAYLSDDGDAIVFLGKDNDLNCDWDKGVFRDNFRGKWGSINGSHCYMDLVYQGDDYNLYSVPIKLNGEKRFLSVAYDYDSDAFYILGSNSGVDESGQAGKDITPLKKGDKLTILYYAQDLSSNAEVEEIEGEKITWKDSYKFTEENLPDGKYAFLFEVTDIKGKSTLSDAAFINYKDGEITPEM